jgi:hypothetical protein
MVAGSSVPVLRGEQTELVVRQVQDVASSRKIQ